MNPENNNVENSMGVQPVEGIDQLNQAPVTPDASQNTFEPMQNMDMPSSDEAFSPFENLNNESLNVPTEAPTDSFNPTPVDPSTFNAEVTSAPIESEPVNAPVTEEIPQTENTFQTDAQPAAADFSFQQPVADDSLIQTAPEVAEPAATESFAYSQSAPTVEELTPAIEAAIAETPATDPAILDAAPVEEVSAPAVDSSVQEPAVETVAEPQGPTIPIPDSMPTTDYQATVSTPVDYATPMSDFDQIGSTPEIDPKAKTKKGNGKKTLLFCLIIVLIAALGCGAYYLINIKQIFKTNSVEVKDLTVNSGETLSTNIDDYGTFKNTSSSNCVLDTSKVDMTKAGKYTYTISCGEDQYQGSVTVIDKTAPEVELNFKYTVAPQPLYKEEIVRSISETDAEYEFTSEEEANTAFSTPGLNIISITAKDASENSKEVVAPVAVLSSDMQFIIIAQKATEDPNVTEKVVAFIRGDITVEVAVKMYVLSFTSDKEYEAAAKTYSGGKEFTYGTYTGIPIFYKSENKIVIITDTNLDYVGQQGNPVYSTLTTEGYTVSTLRQQDSDKSSLNFDYIK